MVKISRNDFTDGNSNVFTEQIDFTKILHLAAIFMKSIVAGSFNTKNSKRYIQVISVLASCKMGTILWKVCSRAQLLLQCEKGNKLKFPSFEDRSRNVAAAKNQIWTDTHISSLFLLFLFQITKWKQQPNLTAILWRMVKNGCG